MNGKQVPFVRGFSWRWRRRKWPMNWSWSILIKSLTGELLLNFFLKKKEFFVILIGWVLLKLEYFLFGNGVKGSWRSILKGRFLCSKGMMGNGLLILMLLHRSLRKSFQIPVLLLHRSLLQCESFFSLPQSSLFMCWICDLLMQCQYEQAQVWLSFSRLELNILII